MKWGRPDQWLALKSESLGHRGGMGGGGWGLGGAGNGIAEMKKKQKEASGHRYFSMSVPRENNVCCGKICIL